MWEPDTTGSNWVKKVLFLDKYNDVNLISKAILFQIEIEHVYN